jgi:hypothetical protein
MGTLNKLIINSNDSIKLAVWQIQNYLKLNIYTGMIILGSNDKIYLGSNKFIPQSFNSHQVFISSESFQQNNLKLAHQVRKYVSDNIKLFNSAKLLCIGGESYLYGLSCKIPQIYHMTNSPSIHLDCEFNSKFFPSKISNNLVDYNKVKQINSDYQIGLINLANLNHNLMIKINDSNLQIIMIVNCHHEDFWKKIKLLTKFKIRSRQYFICDYIKYFLTVTILFRTKN